MCTLKALRGESENKKDRVGGDARDVFLKFEGELREGGDRFNGGDVFESDNGRAGIELGIL